MNPPLKLRIVWISRGKIMVEHGNLVCDAPRVREKIYIYSFNVVKTQRMR
jgi:hypothetical protein